MNDHVPTYVLEHGPLQVPIRVARLHDQVARLMLEPAWQHEGRVGKTLVKEHGLRAVLTLMRQGEALHEHRVAGPSMLQCLRGSLTVQTLGRSIDLVEGELIALEDGIAHRVEAVADCAFLLTITETRDAGPEAP